MKERFDVLSLFDGISCGQQALDRAAIPYGNYYASEINLPSIMVTQSRYPNTIQVGDVRQLRGKDFKGVQVLIGGSPCQNFSMMGKRKGMVTTCNIVVDTLEKYLQLKAEGFEFQGESYLFWEFIRLKEEIKPKYFFLENVRMSPEWANIISRALGVDPILINSALLSAQNRERYYWTNIPLSPIEDLGVVISDIIPDAIVAAGKRGRILPGDDEYTQCWSFRKDGKANCVVTSPYMTGRYVTENGGYKVIDPEHAEALQTIQIGFTNVQGVSKTARYEMLGNAWTVDVVVKFFENLKFESSSHREKIKSVTK